MKAAVRNEGVLHALQFLPSRDSLQLVCACVLSASASTTLTGKAVRIRVLGGYRSAEILQLRQLRAAHVELRQMQENVEVKAQSEHVKASRRLRFGSTHPPPWLCPAYSAAF